MPEGDKPTQLGLRSLPDLPVDASGPIFREPWEAHAFALTLELHQRGLFTWQEWSEALAGEIARARTEGDPDQGDTYYRHWLHALENLIETKGLASRDLLRRRRDAWREAYLRTPHGQPVTLDGTTQPGCR